jgi:oxygen-independent coproporphyrinogen-3 oxidase
MDGEIVGQTVDAIAGEISRSPWRGRPAKTIFFGGGTPTFLDAPSLTRLLEVVLDAHPPLADTEITSEANPGTVDAEKFRAMREAGFNRLSLGAQSFVDSDLLMLERVHAAADIGRAVAAAREVGFDNLNLDLMFALPRQSFAGWSENLERAIALAPEHLSLYCLTIEPNTAFYKRNLRGELDLPDDEAQVSMYEHCVARMSDAGYLQYEISNFARPGSECRHNLEYWHGREYAAYGPGAVGMVDGVRYTNLKHPLGYRSAVSAGHSAAYESESLDAAARRTERIMLGLRLNEGLDPSGLQLSEAALLRLVERGWVSPDPVRVRLTPEGRHFCSEVALALM